MGNALAKLCGTEMTEPKGSDLEPKLSSFQSAQRQKLGARSSKIVIRQHHLEVVGYQEDGLGAESRDNHEHYSMKDFQLLTVDEADVRYSASEDLARCTWCGAKRTENTML